MPKQVRSLGISTPPGRKIFELYLQVESRPTILAKIATIMGEKNIDVLAGSLQASDDKKVGYDLFYLEMADATVTPQELVKLLKSQPYVKDALIESKSSVRFETMMFPLTSSGHTRMFVISAEGWIALVSSIVKTFGTAGGVILHNQGVSVGEQMVEKITGLFGPTPIAKDLVMENFKAYFGAVGFGMLEAKVTPAGYHIVIEQPVTVGGDGHSDQFLVGVVRGAINRSIGVDYVVKNLDYSGGKVVFDLVPGTTKR